MTGNDKLRQKKRARTKPLNASLKGYCDGEVSAGSLQDVNSYLTCKQSEVIRCRVSTRLWSLALQHHADSVQCAPTEGGWGGGGD